MTTAQTATYDQLVLEVEFVPNSGTFTKICGITGVSITRSKNISTTEVPDCDDETKAHEVMRDVRSREVSVSGTGVWARDSHSKMMSWFYADGEAGKLNCRLRNANVEDNGASGDPYVESGKAILATLSNERSEDKTRISASIEIQFDGTPALGTLSGS
ncbi:MAG: hypothetical protein GYB53_15100 [Rhodobacteraceae bacterium]|nr:hypothetical protein [Paracoccaceae bacterium]MBR9823737.1 hypothetical protein [Paracoccaceae bacterium]